MDQRNFLFHGDEIGSAQELHLSNDKRLIMIHTKVVSHAVSVAEIMS